jgi:hypothetical protein
MQTKNLIAVKDFCFHHNIEILFIQSLQQYDLIEIITIEETLFIDKEHLLKLEKIIRLYYDLDINIEGIDSIIHLLEVISSLQDEIILLKNRLR